MKDKDRGKGRCVEVQVCPHCLSAKVCQLSASSGDMTGALTLLPPKYVCYKCGWVGRLVVMRDVEVSDDDDDYSEDGKKDKTSEDNLQL